ncbi:MAG: hypothetical protein K2Q28_01745 [Hyphomicrobium sp.]|nr:hypothetical protein [Hyphomicrobium sp.]
MSSGPLFRTKRISACSMAAALAFAITCGAAAATDPKVPPAGPVQDRRPVAILTTGFDYTRAEIAERLARDGEGEIMAWDVPGDDRFPFAAEGDTELVAALVSLLSPTAPVSLLPVKVDPDDPASLAKAVAFIARTPARTVLVPMWTSTPGTWDLFVKAVTHFSDLRIVIRGCPDLIAAPETRVYPRDFDLPNVATAAISDNDPSAPLQVYVADLPCRRP